LIEARCGSRFHILAPFYTLLARRAQDCPGHCAEVGVDDLLVDFLAETNESLAELDVALIRLERSPGDTEPLSLIFRLVHTIKGTCGFLGLPRLERLAHAAENVLGQVRDGALVATPVIVTAVLGALDGVKRIVADLAAHGGEPAGDDAALISALEAAAAGTAEAAVPPPLEPLADAAASAPVAAGSEAAPAAQTVRVAVDVLEDLMTLVSELVLTRNQLLQLARGQANASLTAPLQRLSQITSDLQEGVMKTRMQPIGNAWAKQPRLVRDLARELDKRIELSMLGADTELDRQVLELIKDPLTHMVRNSADHGLEPSAERRAAGKQETGLITLNAYHEGGHIIIEVADDGRGLPVQRIRAKALAQGLATEAELAAMSDEQILRFIFRAGFSTAAAVTAVSGRGVGMDVVKTNIERIGGSIEVKSIAGRGTTFTIKIPLTLAIVAALIIEASGERFAVPQISVVELVRAGVATRTGQSGPQIERVNDTPVLRLRDRLLPLVRLDELLGLRSSDAQPGDDSCYIVVTQIGGSVLGIIVDRVFDAEEIVVKPLAPILRNVTMFGGNTILGDGSVIMILDPNGIARATGIGGGESRSRAAAAADHHRTDSRTAMLLFRAGDEQIMAVPLGLVARLENVPRDKIESSCGAPVTQYRCRLMPLIALAESAGQSAERQPVLVFADGERSMGLMVSEIVDVVEDHPSIELSGDRPGLLGTAVIAGRATDVIDTAYWLTRAHRDWFHGVAHARGAAPLRILVVEDSDFFRQLLLPTLEAAGYVATGVAGASDALRLRDAGERFDAIISDIAMPSMDGLDLARAVRAGGAWESLPLIALSGRVEPGDVEAAREAGFTDYVAKFDRTALTESLRQWLAVAES
jgi:two-component system chemotaxis sensor kinase CheA